MANPYKNFSELQAAWMGAWLSSMQHMMQCWGHVYDLQQSFLKHAEAHHRSHVEIARGPSFLDKYGRRSHDIDPERDV